MSEGQATDLVRPPLIALDFVRMYLLQTEGMPANGHYLNAVACRRKSPAGRKDDPHSRCTRCDGEALMRDLPPASPSHE